MRTVLLVKSLIFRLYTFWGIMSLALFLTSVFCGDNMLLCERPNMINNKPNYTGDIAAQEIDLTKEYSTENQELVFSDEQNSIWADLFAGVYQPYLLEHICQEWGTGMELLQLDPKKIPTVAHINQN